MAEKKWINVLGKSKQGNAATKQTISTDYTINRGLGSVIINYALQGFWEINSPYGQESEKIFDLPEAGYITEIGSPMLITEGLFVAMPRNAEFIGIKILSYDEEELDFEVDVLPVPKPALEMEEMEFVKNDDIYSSDEKFPNIDVEYVDTVSVYGVKSAHILVYPVKYKPKSKKIYSVTNLMFEVQYKIIENATDMDESHPIYKSTLGNNSMMSSQILGLIEENSLDSFEIPKMLILTASGFESSLQRYIKHKSNQFTSEIVTVESIVTKYPSLSKVEAIHTFIMDKHKESSLTYVLLAADVKKIPALEVTVTGIGTFLSDSYYSAPKNEYLPLFKLSRFPASSKDELEKMCNHAINYTTNKSKADKKTILTTFRREDYQQCKEDIYNKAESMFNMVKCYDGMFSKKQLIDEINKGQTFINYRGHGNYNCWQSSNGLSTSDVNSLKDVPCTPHVFSICCNNNDMRKKDCFGVAWIKNMKAITFLGASAPSYTVVNHKFDKYIWEALHDLGLTNISDIYVWATTTLYKNQKGDDLTKTNIKEYLLLGDPSSDYLEDLKTVGYVTMLDASGTMYDVQSIVSINAKAFVDYSLCGDQFGVNMFNQNANWIYPSNSAPVTVSESLKETTDAANMIEEKYKIPSKSPLTNIGEAIRLGNDMYSKFTTDINAFVLLSDGAHNIGRHPNEILGSNPPIYIAGLGPYFRESYYKTMLQKNPLSKLYYYPDAYEMMLMFNDIRSDSVSCGLLINDVDNYKVGSNYLKYSLDLSSYRNKYQLGVVWSDKKYKYSTGYPGNNNINVIIYDPKNAKYTGAPVKIGNGYCIFDIKDAIPGKWTVLIQYSTTEPISGTIGAFEANPVIKIQTLSSTNVDSLSPFDFKLALTDKNDNPVLDATVTANITKPTISIEDLLEKYEDDLSDVILGDNINDFDDEQCKILKFKEFRQQTLDTDHFDILQNDKIFKMMNVNKDGHYVCGIGETDHIIEGIYTAKFVIEGINKETGYPYKYYKTHSLICK